MTPSPVSVVAGLNGKVQVSSGLGDSSIGLLVERGELFGGVLLTPSQAQQLARDLLMRSCSSEPAGT